MIANYMITPYKSQRCVQNRTFLQLRRRCVRPCEAWRGPRIVRRRRRGWPSRTKFGWNRNTLYVEKDVHSWWLIAIWLMIWIFIILHIHNFCVSMLCGAYPNRALFILFRIAVVLLGLPEVNLPIDQLLLWHPHETSNLSHDEHRWRSAIAVRDEKSWKSDASS